MRPVKAVTTSRDSMPDPIKPIRQIRYKTYLKKAFTQALRPVFKNHPDPLVATTQVTLDMPLTEQEYPSVVIRFYERDFKNMGVAHEESIETKDLNGDFTGRYQKYKHYLYHGDVEFAVYALSTYDRDLISDALVQILTMGDAEIYTNAFLARLYTSDEMQASGSTSHFVNLNTDSIQGFGENQAPAPWGPEDKVVYSSSYRANMSGEVYSRTVPNVDYGLLERVEIYPYMTSLEPIPNPKWSGPDGIQGTSDDQVDPAPWI